MKMPDLKKKKNLYSLLSSSSKQNKLCRDNSIKYFCSQAIGVNASQIKRPQLKLRNSQGYNLTDIPHFQNLTFTAITEFI